MFYFFVVQAKKANISTWKFVQNKITQDFWLKNICVLWILSCGWTLNLFFNFVPTNYY